MANAIRILVSLMAVLLCLASSGCAQDDSEFSTEASRLVAIYTNPAVSEVTKERNLGSLAKFYEQNCDLIQLPEEAKQRASELLEKYKRSYGAEENFDGVAANGGWISSVVRHLLIEEAIELVEEGVEGAHSSAKGVVINREVALFGLVFLVGSYMFRNTSM